MGLLGCRRGPKDLDLLVPSSGKSSDSRKHAEQCSFLGRRCSGPTSTVQILQQRSLQCRCHSTGTHWYSAHHAERETDFDQRCENIEASFAAQPESLFVGKPDRDIIQKTHDLNDIQFLIRKCSRTEYEPIHRRLTYLISLDISVELIGNNRKCATFRRDIGFPNSRAGSQQFGWPSKSRESVPSQGSNWIGSIGSRRAISAPPEPVRLHRPHPVSPVLLAVQVKRPHLNRLRPISQRHSLFLGLRGREAKQLPVEVLGEWGDGYSCRPAVASSTSNPAASW